MPISRREFVGIGSAAISAAALHGRTGPDARPQVGLLGLGLRGQQCLSEMAWVGVQVVAFDPSHRARLSIDRVMARTIRFMDDEASLLSSPDIAGVVIAAPAGERLRLIEASLAAGKPVYALPPLFSEPDRIAAVLNRSRQTRTLLHFAGGAAGAPAFDEIARRGHQASLRGALLTITDHGGPVGSELSLLRAASVAGRCAAGLLPTVLFEEIGVLRGLLGGANAEAVRVLGASTGPGRLRVGLEVRAPHSTVPLALEYLRLPDRTGSGPTVHWQATFEDGTYSLVYGIGRNALAVQREPTVSGLEWLVAELRGEQSEAGRPETRCVAAFCGELARRLITAGV